MPYEAIKYEKDGVYALVTLNRPERLNALGKQMTGEILQLIEEVTASNEINVLLLTGTPRPDDRPCFCAGADLKDIRERGFLHPLTIQTGMQNIVARERYGDGAFWERVVRCPKITIAAIDGVCSAGGLELALACDIILVSETAQVGDLHMKNIGGIGAAVTVNMARRVGVNKAIELICTSDFIDGHETHRIHFANQVFPPDELMDGARELARRIGGMRPNATQMVKACCNAVYNMDYRTAWRYADACSIALGGTPRSNAPEGNQPPGKWLFREFSWR